ncbi:MAG: hypothetical protein ACE5KE_00355 [Methanosarcinales archaeon]
MVEKRLLTSEEREHLKKAIDKFREIDFIRLYAEPLFDHKRFDPKIIEKLKIVKEELNKIKLEEVSG